MKRSLGPARRRVVHLTVELTFDRSALRLFGESQNMSQTGMLILSEDPKPPGTPVRFRLLTATAPRATGLGAAKMIFIDVSL